jgi:ABC-2 type transport system permease protein
VTTHGATVRAALGAYALAAREIKRFLRQRNRVFGALAQPILFWALFGAGLSPSFHPAAGSRKLDYAEYFFPGIVVLIVLFTAIFATISIIEDRNEGFLQSVLVSPIPTLALVLGKIGGASALALGQALLCFVLAPVAGVSLSATSIGFSIVLLALIALALTGLGFTIAWRLDSTQGFHAIMTAFLMPMWLLSGAFFPSGGVPAWLAWIIAVNPLTYGVAALRRILYLEHPETVSDLPGLGASIAVVTVFALAMVSAAHFSVTHAPSERARP